jgi:hypothetical protein
MVEELPATEPPTNFSTVYILPITSINKLNIILVLSIESADLIEVPITDCGGLVDDHGGIITMHNMSSPNAARLYVSFLFTNWNNIQSI